MHGVLAAVSSVRKALKSLVIVQYQDRPKETN
jgi:hypothetical protein